MKRMNKKGFTLAELLIVVAIIAVLTAIAVPLFVGALDDAKKSVKDANIRVVRAEAVDKILLDQQKPEADQKYKPSKESGVDTWYVRAQITSGGAVKVIEISGTAPVEGDKNSAKYTLEGTAEEDTATDNKGGYIVYLKLQDLTPGTTLTKGA